ncbi:hypothetical protein EHI47_07280 [Rhizobium leguminosarum]|uniref:CopC domain-containing protein n=1 Tax=Rhizobium leguminosarum TaxID=384 RepID=A0A444I7U1_RHILE|nr:copper resistance protein CopC [Rhizobium leguminosarum]RWX34193.1 hypothetical protein EHI47_07280 [Rhizobium leguminosarum]
MSHWIRIPTLSLLAGLAMTADALAAIDPSAPTEDTIDPGDNITLTFSAPVAANRTTVRLSGPRGPVAVGELYTGNDPVDLIVPVSDNLPAGVYFIRFDAYSVSGVRMNGVSSVLIPDCQHPQIIGNGSSADAIDRP